MPGSRPEDPEEGNDPFLGLFGSSGAADAVWRIQDVLCYKAHGGSGYGFTRADVLDMELAEAIWHTEKLAENREEESKAIRAKRSGR